MTERTLVLVKPDGVRAGHVGDVIARLERRGYQLEALKLIEATEAQLRLHYDDKVDKPFFPSLVDYMTSGPIVGIVVSGTDIVRAFRTMAGVTNPTEAQPGTIRGDFGRDWGDGSIQNVVHSSDSPDHAEREIAIWFPELELTETYGE
jgi:nucleoside-diphosphate kinase